MEHQRPTWRSTPTPSASRQEPSLLSSCCTAVALARWLKDFEVETRRADVSSAQFWPLFAPTVVIALALQDVVRDALFGPGPIAAAWIIGGVAILAVPRQFGDRLKNGELSDLTIVHAVWIGVAQAVALWPGVSRSLVTIAAALAVGLSLKAAVEFSFLLGLITLSAATAYEALSNGSNLIDTFGLMTPAIGLVMAFLSAVVAVRWMVTWLEERSFAVFGWYRIAAGGSLLVLMAAGTV